MFPRSVEARANTSVMSRHGPSNSFDTICRVINCAGVAIARPPRPHTMRSGNIMFGHSLWSK